jgi:hypothetical protein
LKITLKGLPSEVAKRMTFEEQLIRTTWTKGSTTPTHLLGTPLKDPYPKILGRDSFKGGGL